MLKVVWLWLCLWSWYHFYISQNEVRSTSSMELVCFFGGLWFRWNVIKRNFSSLESFSGTIYCIGIPRNGKFQLELLLPLAILSPIDRFASWLFVFMAMTSKEQRIFKTYYFSTGTMKLLRSVIRWDVFCNKQKSSKSIPTKCPSHLLDSIYITTVAAVATAGRQTDRQTIGQTDSRIS